jgi:hypothetical protein
VLGFYNVVRTLLGRLQTDNDIMLPLLDQDMAQHWHIIVGLWPDPTVISTYI